MHGVALCCVPVVCFVPRAACVPAVSRGGVERTHPPSRGLSRSSRKVSPQGDVSDMMPIVLLLFSFDPPCPAPEWPSSGTSTGRGEALALSPTPRAINVAFTRGDVRLDANAKKYHFSHATWPSRTISSKKEPYEMAHPVQFTLRFCSHPR